MARATQAVVLLLLVGCAAFAKAAEYEAETTKDVSNTGFACAGCAARMAQWSTVMITQSQMAVWRTQRFFAQYMSSRVLMNGSCLAEAPQAPW